jgi:hypothetical protein
METNSNPETTIPYTPVVQENIVYVTDTEIAETLCRKLRKNGNTQTDANTLYVQLRYHSRIGDLNGLSRYRVSKILRTNWLFFSELTSDNIRKYTLRYY